MQHLFRIPEAGLQQFCSTVSGRVLSRVPSSSLTAILFDLETSNLVCSSRSEASLQWDCSRSAAPQNKDLTERLQIWYVASTGDSTAPLQHGSSRFAAYLQEDCSRSAAL